VRYRDSAHGHIHEACPKHKKGIIARQDASGLRIAFDSVDVDSFIHLKNIVMYNASDPDVIEKEIFSLE